MPEHVFMSEIEIITDGGRRRRWTAAEKLRIVEETLDDRASISVVARRKGVAPNLLYRWRRLVLEAPLLETYPVVPLMPKQGVGIAVMSYCGSLFWGFNSDWEQTPDLHELVLATKESFRELHEAALKSDEAPVRTESQAVRAKQSKKP